MTSALSPVQFDISETAHAPFPYFLAERCLDLEIEHALLDWFETDAPWRLVEKEFYEQYEFSMLDAELPGVVNALTSSKALNRLRAIFERQFDTCLTSRIDLVAHKLIAGQRIAIHNDYLTGAETHRLTVQINRGLVDDQGGFFMLFNSFDAGDVHRILRPISGTGVGFEIGPNSHHAVSRMHSGERYTLVYSFHADAARIPH
ncbi:MAG: hypothetical protein CTY39_11700 [Hyphomicrobium sp.]|nr:MAG: hypothetical protein CTY39_11700 [Hyphomicrobium sp.]